MRPILLGVTPQLHEARVIVLRGVLNRATVLIAILIAIPTVLWLGHAIGTIPSFFPRQLPPEVTAAIGSIGGSIDGATGFMIDKKHFLTTERALKGDGGSVLDGEASKISFPDPEGKATEPVEGKVVWISDPTGGTRLVLLAMAEERMDFLFTDPEGLVDGSRFLVAGHLLNSEDGKTQLSQGSAGLTLFEDDTLGSADWGEADEPLYEGAPVVAKTDDGFAAVGLLSQGSLIVKLPVEKLREAGADL